MACGVDVGTYSLVVNRRDQETQEIKSKREINAFLKIPLENRYTFNMLKKSKVKLIEWEDVAYAVGEDAVNLAYTLNIELRRPMKDGCLNPTEHDAFRILSKMIHSMIGEVPKDKEILYYCVPANAINHPTDAEYHQKILDQIFKSYKYKDKTIQAYPINEALALVFAEFADKNFTGIGISWGGGLVNVCYSIFSQPVFTFSVAGSGDWIDQQAARACGETPIVINQEKMKIDLNKTPTSIVERAIQSQYRILIERVVSNIKKYISESNKVRSDAPLDIVLAGGVTSPSGFENIFRETINTAKLPMLIGDIRKPSDHHYTVARGCLVAAENAN